jgi:hypothetical protein
LIGGDGLASGQVNARTIGNIRIAGALLGGTGNFSGYINTVEEMGHVRIGGDLVGGSALGPVSLFRTGYIESLGAIASVTIGGSLIAGFVSVDGTLTQSGAIVAADDIGPVQIAGSIVGNSTNPVLIIARGQELKPATGFDIAIASLTVGGDVRFANILAGFNEAQSPTNADASIGPVKVGRDWVASSLVAGAQDTGAAGFGVGDTLQPGGASALIARIASVLINGDVVGSITAADNFGFVAQQIDKLKIGPRTFLLAPGPSSASDNILIPSTDDVHLLEV